MSRRVSGEPGLRAVVRDFSESTFELQVKYNTGWETLSRPNPFYAPLEFSEARERWPHLQVRLLQDGKRVPRWKIEPDVPYLRVTRRAILEDHSND